MHAYFSPSAQKDALHARIRRAHDIEQVLDRKKSLGDLLQNFRWDFAVQFCVGRHVHLVPGMGPGKGILGHGAGHGPTEENRLWAGAGSPCDLGKRVGICPGHLGTAQGGEEDVSLGAVRGLGLGCGRLGPCPLPANRSHTRAHDLIIKQGPLL